jgi:RNase P subunit RPR2
MNTRHEYMAQLFCHGCEEMIMLPISLIRVERPVVFFICDECGELSRRFDLRAVDALIEEFDRAGGTQVSEREVDAFARELRRIELHFDELLG